MYDSEVSNYLEHQVLNASPAELIDMLFDRACRDLKTAREFLLDKSDPVLLPEAVRFIIHAQKIVTELQRSLNLKEGGELALSLDRIYEFMQFRLSESAKHRDPDAVGEVHDLLHDIHKAWHTSLIVEGPGIVEDSTGRNAGILVA